jgi:O6-methylguanine-DNA--protein-cysteine methyltransferase
MIFPDMDTQMKYAIFNTAWGYFGLAADKTGLIRTCLPCPTRKTVEKSLLVGLKSPQFNKDLLKPLQKQIIAYFAGKSSLCPPSSVLSLLNLTPFARKVLGACMKIPAGKTVSYS